MDKIELSRPALCQGAHQRWKRPLSSVGPQFWKRLPLPPHAAAYSDDHCSNYRCPKSALGEHWPPAAKRSHFLGRNNYGSRRTTSSASCRNLAQTLIHALAFYGPNPPSNEQYLYDDISSDSSSPQQHDFRRDFIAKMQAEYPTPDTRRVPRVQLCNFPFTRTGLQLRSFLYTKYVTLYPTNST